MSTGLGASVSPYVRLISDSEHGCPKGGQTVPSSGMRIALAEPGACFLIVTVIFYPQDQIHTQNSTSYVPRNPGRPTLTL